MNNDLISRSAAIEALNQHSYETSRDYDKTVELLNELPALNVAPVVRCKECTWFSRGYCMRFDDDVIPDDFCSRGHTET